MYVGDSFDGVAKYERGIYNSVAAKIASVGMWPPCSYTWFCNHSLNLVFTDPVSSTTPATALFFRVLQKGIKHCKQEEDVLEDWDQQELENRIAFKIGCSDEDIWMLFSARLTKSGFFTELILALDAIERTII